MTEPFQGPLTVNDNPNGECYIRDAEGRIVATVHGRAASSDGRMVALPREAFAHRVVACANACAKLSTEALEAGALQELIKVARTRSVDWIRAAVEKLEK